jgi:addiction module HigA family antidote
MSVNELAERAQIDRVSASRILNGRRRITPDVSVRLGRVFGVNDAFFLDLESAVQLWTAARNYEQHHRRVRPVAAHLVHEESLRETDVASIREMLGGFTATERPSARPSKTYPLRGRPRKHTAARAKKEELKRQVAGPKTFARRRRLRHK